MFGSQRQKQLNGCLLNGTLLLICALWTIPTLGLLVSSFRNRDDIQTSGWWNVLPHRAWETTREIDPRALELDATGPMEVEGVTATFEELSEGSSPWPDRVRQSRQSLRHRAYSCQCSRDPTARV